MASRLWVKSAQRLGIISFLFALGLFLLLPTTSRAQAILLRTDPAKDALLKVAPSQIHLWFSEKLNPATSTAYVVNAETTPASALSDVRTHIDMGDAHLSASDSKELDLSLKHNVSAGLYLVVWRVQSAVDGHSANGGFLFSVEQSIKQTPALKNAHAGPNAGKGSITATSSTAGTFLLYTVTALAVFCLLFWAGAQLWLSFLLFILKQRSNALDALLHRVQQRFETKFALPTLAALLLVNAGRGFLQPTGLDSVWVLQEIVITLAVCSTLVIVLTRQRSRLVHTMGCWCNLLLLVILCGALAQPDIVAAVGKSNGAYGVVIGGVYLGALSLWLGGMFFVAVVYLPALREETPLEQVRLLLVTLPYYGLLILVGMVLTMITGSLIVRGNISAWEQLFATVYGHALLITLVVSGISVLLIGMQFMILRPRLDNAYTEYMIVQEFMQSVTASLARVNERIEAKATLFEARTVKRKDGLVHLLRWEPLLGLVIVMALALMRTSVVSQQLSSQQQQAAVLSQLQHATPTTQAFTSVVKTTDRLYTIQFDASPNRMGLNDFAVHVLDVHGKTVANVTGSLSVIMLDMNMGVEHVALSSDETGILHGEGYISMEGRWQIRVLFQSGDHRSHEATFQLYTPKQ